MLRLTLWFLLVGILAVVTGFSDVAGIARTFSFGCLLLAFLVFVTGYRLSRWEAQDWIERSVAGGNSH